MRTLEVEEVQLVSGGDSWGGTPEGQASATPYQDCVNAGFAGGAGGFGRHALLPKCFFLSKDRDSADPCSIERE